MSGSTSIEDSSYVHMNYPPGALKDKNRRLMCMLMSRHARVSVDAMLEALQGSATVQQEEKLGEEDEALITSIFKVLKSCYVFTLL
ncbi:hypothetical protein L1987_01827 [Smallanthus sonchifolius]|uniref:Uncharacterized protein n=1 Tax=Smallanthus sonchifolius TaxID=185202 RepID=A0ACB9K640_9ASTR|nr:hypothetical protein L1987_01827 [Smallanthus sonchifolius]